MNKSWLICFIDGLDNNKVAYSNSQLRPFIGPGVSPI